MRRIFERRIFKSRVRVTRLIIATLSVASLSLGIAARIIPHLGTSAASNRPPAVATYTLITGDRVLVTRTPDGKPTVSIVPDCGGGTGSSGGGGLWASLGGLQTLARGQHLYVVPDAAAGYIGAPLSIDLFDVNAMAPDSASTATTQPQLSVEFTAGSVQQLPPGLSKKTNGSIVVTDRTQFGKALAQSWRTDANGTTSQLFDGIKRIAPAGASATTSSAPTPPPGKLYTVTVKAFDRSGRPAVDASVELDSVDNFTTYSGAFQGFFRGTAAFSVPAGHYDLVVSVHTHYPDNSFDAAFAITPELEVTGDQTIVIEAKKAQLLSVTTPSPAIPEFQEFTYERVDAQGSVNANIISEFSGVPLYITPSTSPVSVGTVWFGAQNHLVNPEGDPAGYTYDLAFPYGNAIPSTLAETVTAGQLATIHARYHSPVLGRLESVGRAPVSPGQLLNLAFLTPVVAPAERTEYVTAQSKVFWQQIIDVIGASGADFNFMQGTLASYTPGQQTQDDWLAQPMASGLQQETIQDPGLGQVCPLCRSGDTLTTFLFPFTDQHAYLFSFGPATTENLTLYQNGTQVGQLPYGYGATFAISPDPATYKLVYEVTKDDPTWPTPTGVHTAWTFASQERTPDHLPPGWTCDTFFTPNAGSGCSFEPLLLAAYSTPTAGLDNVLPAGGPATVDVTVRHQRGAVAAPISHFSAQVSYDDGHTWQDAPATDQGNGVYRLQYTQPDLKATSGFATLRIQATDSNGSAIDQTITRAYPLAATPPAQLPTKANQGSQPACATATVAPYVQCMALVNTNAGISASQPQGLGPSDIQSAYHLLATAGQGRTVAIVDAFDDPNAEADLAAYRAHYGLPACSSANGCFTKINQRGETANYPQPDPGWALEISLDLDAVSATCPQCRILLVEGDTSLLQDLTTAVQTAQRLGANVISNSYGSFGEFSGEQVAERAYRDLSVPFVASSGDYGYGNASDFGATGPAFPAVSQYAIAVGGTSLTRADTPRGWSELVWGEVFDDSHFHFGATSGCSAYIHKPGWQKDTLCSMRTVADVSAVADPATGLAVYDSFFFDGWLQVGGTSLAAPIISAVFAMAGNGSTVRYASNLYSHAGTSDLNDVIGGINATSTQCVNANYLCTGVPGYDGPTGLGTPNGTNAFH